jgi:hypothetical protein
VPISHFTPSTNSFDAGDDQPSIGQCTAGSVKQGGVKAFAANVEMLREALNICVAGFFITKKAHQRGAIKVGQFYGIEIVVSEEGSAPPGFNIIFHQCVIVGRALLIFPP